MGRKQRNSPKSTTAEDLPVKKLEEQGEEERDDDDRSLGRACTLLLFLLSLTIYLSTTYPSLPGGDSGELMVTAKELGVAHPPGYPLFTLLAKLAISGLPLGSTAYRVNALSCLLGAATNALLCSTLLETTGNMSVAVAITGITGFSRLFWIWSITGEVFSLNNALCMAILALVRAFLAEKCDVQRLKLIYGLAFLSGLCLTNQHTSGLLVIPTVGIVLTHMTRNKMLTVRNVVWLTFTGLSSLLLYLQLPISSVLRTARVSWGDHTTLEGFLFHFFRKDYGTLSLVKGSEGVDMMQNYRVLYEDTARELTLPVLGLAAFGILHAAWTRSNVHFAAFLSLSWAAYAGFFCSLANISQVVGIFAGVMERFWLQPSLCLVLLAGLGLSALCRLARVNGRTLLPLAFLVLSARVHSNWGTCDQSNNYHAEAFGRHILSLLPNDSILLTSGDLSTNTFRYLTVAEEVRADVPVLDMAFWGSRWFLPILGHHMKGVSFPGVGYYPRRNRHFPTFTLEDFLEANAARPVFVCLKVKEDTPEMQHWTTVPFSFCKKFVRKGSYDALRMDLPAPSLHSYLPPRTELFGENTWENVLVHEYWEAMVIPGRFLWETAEQTGDPQRRKDLYMRAYDYLYKAKNTIREKIEDGTISPLSWNHTAYFSKYLGVQCRQLWVHVGRKQLTPGSVGAKYDECQRRHFTDYVESVRPLARESDQDFRNIQTVLDNPGM